MITNAHPPRRRLTPGPTHLERPAARIAVSDYGDRRPRMRVTRNTEPGGFGMQLLERLAHRWGVTPRHPGKTAWAELSPAP